MNHIYAEKRYSFFSQISNLFGLSAIVLFMTAFILLPVNSYLNIQLLTGIGITAMIAMILMDVKSRSFSLYTEIKEDQYKELY
jgi:hypothetical protein